MKLRTIAYVLVFAVFVYFGAMLFEFARAVVGN